MRKTLIWLLVPVLAVVLCMDGCKVAKFLYYNFSDITDHRIFDKRVLSAGTQKHIIPKAQVVPEITGNQFSVLDSVCENNNTVAFLIIQNDSILYEKYFNDYTDTHYVASFSMAKSITSILIGCALQDGIITSLQDPVTKYIPEMAEHGFDKVTLEHVMQMTSGLKFTEEYYSPFSDAATYYYGSQLERYLKKAKLKTTPGTEFEYVSGNTQILGLVLKRALKTQSVTSYLQQKLWTPMGMEFDASWSLDHKDGLEKTFCCLNARARDFARLGLLYLHKGTWQGTQLVDSTWVKQSTTATLKDGGVDYYKYQWWLGKDGDFYANGHLGQYIFVCPSKNMVLVRLGKAPGDIEWPMFMAKVARGDRLG